MNDNQEIKVGLTDGDDSQELQPSCNKSVMDGDWYIQELIKPPIDGSVIVYPFINECSDEFAITGFWDGDVWLSENGDEIEVTHWQQIPSKPVK